jgi:hypothetical protein
MWMRQPLFVYSMALSDCPMFDVNLQGVVCKIMWHRIIVERLVEVASSSMTMEASQGHSSWNDWRPCSSVEDQNKKIGVNSYSSHCTTTIFHFHCRHSSRDWFHRGTMARCNMIDIKIGTKVKLPFYLHKWNFEQGPMNSELCDFSTNCVEYIY